MTGPAKKPWKLIILISLMITGIIAGRAGIIDWEWVLEQGHKAAGHWWLPPAMVAVKAVLYLFALPGSALFWVAGLLYRPLPATAIITAGGVAGALLAYAFSRRMSTLPDGSAPTASPLFRFMARNTDFFTLAAIRALPFFPHAIINYGAGMLRIPLGKFAAASAIGFAAKGFIYASAIHHAAEVTEISDLASAETLFPLLLLVLLLFIGRTVYRYWLARNEGDDV
jgi:uncharacterized membrane protein YdjX (TVP38/TMEM64 family)